jgi:glycosyltransferase involved in cell wall biosynthesis
MSQAGDSAAALALICRVFGAFSFISGLPSSVRARVAPERATVVAPVAVWGKALKNRVLQVVTDPDRRGAQVFAVELGRYLATRGLEVETVALWPGTSQMQLDVAHLVTGRTQLGFVRPLREKMRTADLVIAHGSHTLMATALASPGVSARIVYRQISDLNFWAGTLSRRLRVRAYLRRMSHAVALWSGAARVLADRFGVPKHHISIVPNGVRADIFSPPTQAERRAARDLFGLDADSAVALYVGALVEEKGVDLAIKAVGQLPDVTLLVVGHGPEQSLLRNLAARVCPGQVIFAGPLNDVRSAYWAADLVVLPSRTESMPAVLIEAGLVGLPVIGTRVGAIPTMIRDGETGFLVDPDAHEVADGIGRALGVPSLGQAGRAHCLATYGIDRVGESWLTVLERQLAMPSRLRRS